MEKLQRIDVLVNNACRGSKGILSSLPYEEFDYILSVGLKAPYELSRLCRDEKTKAELSILHPHGHFSQSLIQRHMPVQKAELLP